MCLLINGCSIGSAINAPPSVDYESIVKGTEKHSVIDKFGSPYHTEEKRGTTTENYNFIDGYHAGYKTRILLYAAGDFFTLGLAEFVFWPMEKLLLQGSEKSATVEYDRKGGVKNLSVFSKKDRELLHKL
jgi:hypothetical protein